MGIANLNGLIRKKSSSPSGWGQNACSAAGSLERMPAVPRMSRQFLNAKNSSGNTPMQSSFTSKKRWINPRTGMHGQEVWIQNSQSLSERFFFPVTRRFFSCLWTVAVYARSVQEKERSAKTRNYRVPLLRPWPWMSILLSDSLAIRLSPLQIIRRRWTAIPSWWLHSGEKR